MQMKSFAKLLNALRKRRKAVDAEVSVNSAICSNVRSPQIREVTISRSSGLRSHIHSATSFASNNAAGSSQTNRHSLNRQPPDDWSGVISARVWFIALFFTTRYIQLNRLSGRVSRRARSINASCNESSGLEQYWRAYRSNAEPYCSTKLRISRS